MKSAFFVSINIVSVLAFALLPAFYFVRVSFAATPEVTLDDVPVSFAEGNSVVRHENALPGLDGGKTGSVVLRGLLNDTGAINTFSVYTIDEISIRCAFFTLERRIYRKTNIPVWVELKASGLIFESGGNRAIPTGFKRIGRADGIVSRARKRCDGWARGARPNVDPNLYKNTGRFKKAFSRFSGRDLRLLEFRRPAAACQVYIDFANSKIAVEAGRYVIFETDNRKDYLVCMAVFDLETLAPLRIIVVNSGEFLE